MRRAIAAAAVVALAMTAMTIAPALPTKKVAASAPALIQEFAVYR